MLEQLTTQGGCDLVGGGPAPAEDGSRPGAGSAGGPGSLQGLSPVLHTTSQPYPPAAVSPLCLKAFLFSSSASPQRMLSPPIPASWTCEHTHTQAHMLSARHTHRATWASINLHSLAPSCQVVAIHEKGRGAGCLEGYPSHALYVCWVEAGTRAS